MRSPVRACAKSTHRDPQWSCEEPHNLGQKLPTQVGQNARQDHLSGRQDPSSCHGGSRQGWRTHSGFPNCSKQKSNSSSPKSTQPARQPKSPDAGPESDLAPGNSPRGSTQPSDQGWCGPKSSKSNSKRSSLRSKQLSRTISKKFPWPQKGSKTQSAPSSQAPQPRTLAQLVSPSAAGSSLPNSTDFCSPVRKSWPTIPQERKEQNNDTQEGHEAAGVTQEAAQEEVDTAHKRHIRNYYLSNSKTFQDGNGNGNF